MLPGPSPSDGCPAGTKTRSLRVTKFLPIRPQLPDSYTATRIWRRCSRAALIPPDHEPAEGLFGERRPADSCAPLPALGSSRTALHSPASPGFSGGTLNLWVRVVATASARRSDRLKLSSSEPTASV